MFFRYPVSDALQDWMVENFHWAIDRGLLRPDTPLVLPTAAFFPAPKGEKQAVAQALVGDFCRILRVTGQIDVVPLDVLPAEYRHSYSQTSQVAGTFQGDGNASVIRYDPALFAQPSALLSTLAHEMLHHVLHGLPDYPPGGHEAEELATDLHVITCGMGVLQMAGAEQAGWQGYLTQPSRAHALALFLAARGLGVEAATAHLPSRSAKALRKAAAQVAGTGDGAALQARLAQGPRLPPV